MAVSMSKSKEEIQQLPLVDLACEILNAKREPYYYRDLMAEIQVLRGLSDAQVTEVIARLYTEINIDGRFICVGQNIWGLKRWYPVDKVADRAPSGKKFIRAADAFDDEEEDDFEIEDPDVDDEIEEDEVAVVVDADSDVDFEKDTVDEEEDADYSGDDADGDDALEEELVEDDDVEDEDDHP